jgi:hypothetical protein
VAVVVIARGFLYPRGNPETNMPSACHSAGTRRIPQCLFLFCRCRCSSLTKAYQLLDCHGATKRPSQ